jgi:hypothetical protein
MWQQCYHIAREATMHSIPNLNTAKECKVTAWIRTTLVRIQILSYTRRKISLYNMKFLLKCAKNGNNVYGLSCSSGSRTQGLILSHAGVLQTFQRRPMQSRSATLSKQTHFALYVSKIGILYTNSVQYCKP